MQQDQDNAKLSLKDIDFIFDRRSRSNLMMV